MLSGAVVGGIDKWVKASCIPVVFADVVGTDLGEERRNHMYIRMDLLQFVSV